MSLNTASAVINFYSRLEDQVAKFYELLASNENYSAGRDTFVALADENRKHKEIVERAYREVITDALEACYAFAMNPSDYIINTDLAKDSTYHEVVKKAIQIEETHLKFCVDASEKSKALMSDVPQALARVGKKKLNRIAMLKSLQPR